MGASMDARDVAEPINLGSPLRDAAVDPKPWDYLPPTNAGEADPHGPLVVAPGIHGVGPKPIRGGEVFVDDPVEGQPVVEPEPVQPIPAKSAKKAK